MTHGKQPTHELSRIQAIVRDDASKLYVTRTAAATAQEILCDSKDIIECILSLTADHFYKSMPSEKKPGRYQDVYKVRFHGYAVYLKLQLTVRDEAVVISFKRDEDA
ncbi:MAG: type II toxin-antitoxin system MqsR family toxin [Longimicrobiales bacterium]